MKISNFVVSLSFLYEEANPFIFTRIVCFTHSLTYRTDCEGQDVEAQIVDNFLVELDRKYRYRACCEIWHVVE